MPMYFVTWTGNEGDDPPCAVLVDAPNEGRAKKIGAAHHGEAPSRVRELPAGTFLAEVFFEEIEEGKEDETDDDGEPLYTELEREHGDTVSYEAVPHVDAMLRLFADDDERPVQRLNLSRAPLDECGAEGETDGGVVVRCELEPGHASDMHRGGGQSWRDE